MHPINAYLDKSYYEKIYDDTIKALVLGKRHGSTSNQQNFDKEMIQPVLPPKQIRTETLFNKTVENASEKFPITNTLFRTMREYSEDEEIKEYEKLQNVLITGGGANIT